MSRAVVITAANSKGGCGKTTTIIILAGEYAAQGHRVHIIDADPHKRSLKWAQYGAAPPSITVEEAGAANIRKVIETAASRTDVILIDVEGTANASLTLAVAYSSVVIIPAKLSPPDVEDGLATAQLVQDMAHAARRTIPYGLLWSCVPSAIRSREMANLEAQVLDAKIPVIGSVFQRAAFAALFSFSTTLDALPKKEVPGLDKAKADAVRLTQAIRTMLEKAAEIDPDNQEAVA